MSLTGESRFDVSTRSNWTYPLRTNGVKTILIEFGPDGNGNATGAVAVYLGEVTAAAPWRTVAINTLRVYPSPECDFVSVVPSAGAQGICTISLSQDPLGVGIFPFEASGGGGGGASTAGTYDVTVTEEPSLSHYFKCEDVGPALVDSAGSAIGTATAGVFGQPGPLTTPSQSLFLNGAGGFVTFANAAIFQPGGANAPFTIEFWWNLDYYQAWTYYPCLLANGHASDYHAGTIQLSNGGSNSSPFSLNYVAAAQSNGYGAILLQTYPFSNVWHLMAITYDGANFTTYDNGVPICCINILGYPFTMYTGSPMLLGQNPGYNNAWTKAHVSRLAIYNAVLPASDLLAHYNAR